MRMCQLPPQAPPCLTAPLSAIQRRPASDGTNALAIRLGRVSIFLVLHGLSVVVAIFLYEIAVRHCYDINATLILVRDPLVFAPLCFTALILPLGLYDIPFAIFLLKMAHPHRLLY